MNIRHCQQVWSKIFFVSFEFLVSSITILVSKTLSSAQASLSYRLHQELFTASVGNNSCLGIGVCLFMPKVFIIETASASKYSVFQYKL